MNREDIKVGETYNVRVRVGRIDTKRFVCQPLNQDGTPSDFSPNYFNFAEAEAFHPVEPAPKYDPCRLFRKGDKVWEVLVKGRRYLGAHNNHKAGELATVTCNEDYSTVMIQYEDGDKFSIDVAYLELVTPVEVLEPYYIEEYPNTCKLMKRNGAKLYKLADYWDTHPRFKAAAVAERDRLNAEYRKEQK